ncbi:MAG: cysteine desulfurase [Cyanobium sp. M30B3]|nr:MAG: cysteine desulfurase [Cyanobium sp. M30B3]
MAAPAGIYLDASATTPPAAAVLAEMADLQARAWANPSSLHGYGLAAAEVLERARWRCAAVLGCSPEELVFTSGGTEAIHLALLGHGATVDPGRLLISAVEHPATVAAAAQLGRQGWQVRQLPVDRLGRLELQALQEALEPPTRLVSLIWGQSEVGTLQQLEPIGELCHRAGVPLHVDAVQVVGHRPVDFSALPVDLLSLAAHKLQGPRGIGALLVRRGMALLPLLAGGGQEGGRRAGTEPVVLAAGLARALELSQQADPAILAGLRDGLLQALLELEGVRLSGPDPRSHPGQRLPHHLSVLVADPAGRALSGRALVRELWREGYALSSGSACSSTGSTASAVLRAMGFGEAEAASGLRLSLGPWLSPDDLVGVAPALERARQRLAATP